MPNKNLFEVIHQRTSIRSFTDQKIPEDILMKIAEAGRASPTAMNKQNRTFTIVKDKKLITQLAQAIEDETGRDDYNFYNPAAILLISVPDESRYSLFEVGAASQNIMLAAMGCGLGSVWTSQINGISNRPIVRQVLDELMIPKTHYCFNVIALGYPAESPPIKERTEKIRLI